MRNHGLSIAASAAAAAALLTVLAACGGGGGHGSGNDAQPTTWASPAMSIQAITQRLALTDDGSGGQTFQGATVQCNIVVVMNTKETVAMYVDAGDNVATNGAKTIGVKFDGGALGNQPDDIPACGQALTTALNNLANH